MKKQISSAEFLLSKSELCLPTHCRCRRLLLHLFTLSDTHTHTHSVVLLCTSDRPVAETYTSQHSQETDIHTPGGIRTHNPSKRAAADQLLRPHGRRARQSGIECADSPCLACHEPFLILNKSVDEKLK